MAGLAFILDKAEWASISYYLITRRWPHHNIAFGISALRSLAPRSSEGLKKALCFSGKHYIWALQREIPRVKWPGLRPHSKKKLGWDRSQEANLGSLTIRYPTYKTQLPVGGLSPRGAHNADRNQPQGRVPRGSLKVSAWGQVWRPDLASGLQNEGQ